MAGHAQLLYLPCDEPQLDFVGSELGPSASCDPGECPDLALGSRGGACDFDGIDDHAHLPASIGEHGSLTIALWARVDAFDGYRSIISKPVGTGTENSWQLEIDPNCPNDQPLTFTAAT